MAETVYKSVPDLDLLPGSLDGSETLPVVKAGKTYRRALANFFGSGWIANLLQAFTAFKAPDSVHADDADTVDGQDTATLHAAENLTGNIHLDRIPAELTGKNAATATLAAEATKLKTARTIGGVSFDGTSNINLPGVNQTGNQNTSGNAATATTASNSNALGGKPASLFISNDGFISGGAGNNIVVAHDVAESNGTTTWGEIKKIISPIAGTIRLSYELYCSTSNWSRCRVYKNGSQLYEDIRQASGYQTFTHDFTVAVGDSITFSITNDAVSSTATIRNARIQSSTDIPFARVLNAAFIS